MDILEVIGIWCLALLVVVNLRSLKLLGVWTWGNWFKVSKVLFYLIYGGMILTGVVHLWGLYGKAIDMPSWKTYWKTAVIVGLYAVIWVMFFRKEAFRRWEYTDRRLYDVLDNLAIVGFIYAVAIIIIAVIRL